MNKDRFTRQHFIQNLNLKTINLKSLISWSVKKLVYENLSTGEFSILYKKYAQNNNKISK